MKKKTYKSLLLITSFLIVLFSSCAKLKLEHEEARNLIITNVDFGKLADGEYVGNYDGGMFAWRKNTCQVTVSESRVSDIMLIESVEDRPQEFFDELYGKVIANQSLQVDVISGATLTSKAHLKAVEDALLEADMETTKLN